VIGMQRFHGKTKIVCTAVVLLLLAPLLLLFSGAKERATSVAENGVSIDSELQVEEGSPAEAAEPASDEHPLDASIRWAQESLARMERIADYSATMVSREQVAGVDTGCKQMFLKVRHEPFSVYLRFLAPAAAKGREAIYVAGQNDDKLLGHETGLMAKIGTVALKPDGLIAMRGERYPITKIGIANLLRELIASAESDKQIDSPVEVSYFKNAKVDGRSASGIQVLHPERHPKHEFYKALIFIDDELGIPIRYAAYDWPKMEGGELPVIDEYTYQDLKVNEGFTDDDFSIENPDYDFPPRTF
jgi:hypothetical protein